jgi:hypothetical protein
MPARRFRNPLRAALVGPRWILREPVHSLRRRSPGRVAGGLLLTSLLLVSGCRTSKDAVSAASQMAETAGALSAYYSGLRTILANTDLVFQINEALYAKPYSAENRQLLADAESSLAKRAALASELSAVSGQFWQLTHSTAPADVATAAAKLQTEIDGLASIKASSAQQASMKSALQLLVNAAQEHKERDAARAMDQLFSSLAALFDAESDVWQTREELYSRVAGNLAASLVESGSADNCSLLQQPLTPLGMSWSCTAETRAKLQSLELAQLAVRQKAFDTAYDKTSTSMSQALHEMASRIHLLATGKPFAYTMPPLTVANVEQWAAQAAAW